MLSVIDEVEDEGDSLMKRAKINYENKPKLIELLEELYRSHRSLAQKHDLLIKTSSLNSDSHNSSSCDEIRSEVCEETESSDVEAETEKDQIVEFDDGDETMKEELEILREENRVYKEKKEVVTRLLANLVRVCFCFQFNWEIFSYHLLRFCLLFSHDPIGGWVICTKRFRYYFLIMFSF